MNSDAVKQETLRAHVLTILFALVVGSVATGCGGAGPPGQTPPTTGAAPPTTTPSATSGSRAFTHPSGIWSLEYPGTWTRREWRLQGQAFLSYDPDVAPWETGVRFESGASIVPAAEARLHVEVWPNVSKMSTREYVDAWLGEAVTRSHATLVSREQVRLGNIDADRLILEDEAQNVRRRSIYWLSAMPQNELVLILRAWPAETTRRAELDALLASFRFLK
jgi:hypothetical protein